MKNEELHVHRDDNLHKSKKNITFAAEIHYEVIYQRNMPTIDTYRFNSDVEPSDEILGALMREVAKEAKARYAAAHTTFFKQIQTMAH